MKRRTFLGMGVGTTTTALWPGLQALLAAQGSGGRINEDDPSNVKLAHRLNARGITDDDLLFLKQIGMRWARLEFGAEPTPFETLRATQQRFARHGIRIFSGVHYADQRLHDPVVQ